MVAQRTNPMNSIDLVSNNLMTGSNSITRATDSKSFSNLLSKSSTHNNFSDSLTKNLATKETNEKLELGVSQKKSFDTNKKQVTQNKINKTENYNTSDMNEKASKLVKDIKEVVKEILGISEEELTSIMEVLGISMIDFLQPTSVQQLVLASSGNDDLMLMLTDENLSSKFRELMGAITELLDESNSSFEELAEMFSYDEFLEFLHHDISDTQNNNNMVVSEESFIANQTVNSETGLEKSMDVVDSDVTDEALKTIEFSAKRIVDTENDGNLEDNGNQTSKKESATADNFIEQIVSSITTTETNFSGELSNITTIREIATQIVEQIKVVIRPNQTSMQMQLNPEHLGKVALSVTQKAGVMTAVFTTQTEMAKEAIENQMHVLRQNLESQGIKVEVMEVTVAAFSFTQSNEAGNGQESNFGKGKRSFRMELETEAEIAEDSSILPSGLLDETVSSIDYSA